jgi:MFS family permease
MEKISLRIKFFTLAKVKKNISKLIIIKVTKWLMLFMPIIKAFYEANELGDYELFLLHGIYSLIIAVLEIPSGYLADVWGRKNALIAGMVFGTAGFASYATGEGFTGFLVAEIFLGIGHSMISGADSALLYDSLLDVKREKEYLKYEGRITAFGNFSEAAAAIVGGFIANYISLRFTYVGQTAISVIGMMTALTLVNPSSHKGSRKFHLSDILHITKYALVQHRQLRSNILLSSVIGLSTLSMAWFTQIYYTSLGLSLTMMGFIWFALNMAPGITSMYAHIIERKLGMKNTIYLLILFIPAGYLLLSTSISICGLLVLFIFYLTRGIATPVLKDYINKITTSDIRATVLSIRSLLIRVTFAVVGPAMGKVSDTYGIQTSLLISGIFILIFGILTGLNFISRQKDRAHE